MSSILSDQDLSLILEKAFSKKTITEEDILFLLKLSRKDHLDSLFKAARDLRSMHFKNKVFLYGFIYISTYCRNDCNFCFYRVSNSLPFRYRKKNTEILNAAADLAGSGVHLIDITMGEDPDVFNRGDNGFDPLLKLIKDIKETVKLPVMVSPGLVPSHIVKAIAGAGASWYACYQETHNRSFFEKLRPDQNYNERIDIKRVAKKYGLLTEEGILVGGGESVDDIAHSIDLMRKQDIDQVRAMNFIPQDGTPMGDHPATDPVRELIIIAVMRLIFPDRLIPASLDVEGLGGLKQRLDAGANVVTSIVPPYQGLAGVAQHSLDIDEARRTIKSVLPVLESSGLCVAGRDDLKHWMDKRIRHTKTEFNEET